MTVFGHTVHPDPAVRRVVGELTDPGVIADALSAQYQGIRAATPGC